MLTAGQARQAIVEWRNWTLPVKLAAVVVVPVVFAMTLSVAQIHAQVAESDNYEELGQVVDAITTLQPLIVDVQQERSTAVAWLTGDATPGALSAQGKITDGAATAVSAMLQDPAAFGPVVAARYADVHAQLSLLSGLRQRVESSQVESPAAIQSYSNVAQSLLALDQALTNTGADQQVSNIGTALHDLATIEEENSQQQAWMQSVLANDNFDTQSLDMIRASQARMAEDVANFGAIAAIGQQNRLNSTLNSPAAQSRSQGVTTVLAQTSTYSHSVPISLPAWNSSSRTTATALATQWRGLALQLRQRAAQLEENASNIAGLDSVVLLSAMLAAAAIMIIVTRQLLRSLRRLRRSALEVAEYELPSAVAQVRINAGGDVDIRRIPVETTEEVGQVARAFDEVNQQALRLAIEQATLRRGFSESFINVSRRSQSLLERQLLLFEELEQDEEDPDQLARLFQLDHLATRMRRNNENLMVLSGSDLARRFTQPVPIADVLRAAVSEIEQYPRVIVQSAPTVKLAGHVASDLVRLMAEVLDNAANFSAPDTSVTVSSHQAEEDSVIIDVLDRGIGMTENELAEANAQLASDDGSEWAMSRRMGLLVAGRLAGRHGISVELHGGREVEGVRATVMIPYEHVTPDAAVPRAAAAKSTGRNGFHHHDLPTSGSLPQRGATFGENLFEPVADTPDQIRGLFEPTVAVSQDDIHMTHEFEPNWPIEEPERASAHEAATEWFHPTVEDARHQAQVQREYEQQGWPTEGPVVSDPSTWQEPGPDLWGAQPPAAPAPARHSIAEQPRQQPARTSAGLPRRIPATPGKAPSRADNAHGPEQAREGAWSFAMDDVRQLAEAAANSEPTSYTTAGLPRRTPRAQLAPGSVPLIQDDGDFISEELRRDPDRLRGRLSDFQSGVRRGRHSATEDEN